MAVLHGYKATCIECGETHVNMNAGELQPESLQGCIGILSCWQAQKSPVLKISQLGNHICREHSLPRARKVQSRADQSLGGSLSQDMLLTGHAARAWSAGGGGGDLLPHSVSTQLAASLFQCMEVSRT